MTIFLILLVLSFLILIVALIHFFRLCRSEKRKQLEFCFVTNYVLEEILAGSIVTFLTALAWGLKTAIEEKIEAFAKGAESEEFILAQQREQRARLLYETWAGFFRQMKQGMTGFENQTPFSHHFLAEKEIAPKLYGIFVEACGGLEKLKTPEEILIQIHHSQGRNN